MIKKLWFWYGKRKGLLRTDGALVLKWETPGQIILACRHNGYTFLLANDRPLVFNRTLTDAELILLREQTEPKLAAPSNA
jgi:hypothetical protein